MPSNVAQCWMIILNTSNPIQHLRTAASISQYYWANMLHPKCWTNMSNWINGPLKTINFSSLKNLRVHVVVFSPFLKVLCIVLEAYYTIHNTFKKGTQETLIN